LIEVAFEYVLTQDPQRNHAAGKCGLSGRNILENPVLLYRRCDNVVDKSESREGRVWINKDQYFADVREVSWGFYIGGYEPAQKWLKDRTS